MLEGGFCFVKSWSPRGKGGSVLILIMLEGGFCYLSFFLVKAEAFSICFVLILIMLEGGFCLIINLIFKTFISWS